MRKAWGSCSFSAWATRGRDRRRWRARGGWRVVATSRQAERLTPARRGGADRASSDAAAHAGRRRRMCCRPRRRARTATRRWPGSAPALAAAPASALGGAAVDDRRLWRPGRRMGRRGQRAGADRAARAAPARGGAAMGGGVRGLRGRSVPAGGDLWAGAVGVRRTAGGAGAAGGQAGARVRAASIATTSRRRCWRRCGRTGRPGVRVLNLADDEPAASAEVVAEAARLLGVPSRRRWSRSPRRLRRCRRWGAASGRRTARWRAGRRRRSSDRAGAIRTIARGYARILEQERAEGAAEQR